MPDPRLALVFVAPALLAAVTAWRWRWNLRRGARADAPPGLLTGTIVRDRDEPVIRVELDLKLTILQSGGRSVEERKRTVHVRPFEIETATGERVTIDPPRDVELHADLGSAHMIERFHRYTKTAEVRPGQRVYVISTPRMIVSTEKLGATARRAAANDKRWLRRWAWLTVLAPVLLVPPVGLFVLGFWIRDMIVRPEWWAKKRYREFYSHTRADTREYRLGDRGIPD